MSRRRKLPRPESPSISVEQARLQFHELIWRDIRGAPFCTQGIQGSLSMQHRHAAMLLSSDQHKTTVLFCEDGVASRHTVAWLYASGKRNVLWLEGGFRYWQNCHPETLVPYDEIPALTSDGTG